MFWAVVVLAVVALERKINLDLALFTLQRLKLRAVGSISCFLTFNVDTF
jgi:hypothetical protein